METLRIDQVRDYTTRFGQEALHPLLSVIDLNTVDYVPGARAESILFNCYAVFLKGAEKIHIRYGRQSYDYQDGTLIFFAPGQLVDISTDGPNYRASGQALLFHPDLLLGTALAGKMHEYHFFGYAVNEALHLNEKERHLAQGCFERLQYELERDADRHSRRVMVSILEMFLNYCDRFYDRQFATRDVSHEGVLAGFERELQQYYRSGQARERGPATVAFFADRFHLSPNYFGDLIRKETGRSAQDHIQSTMIRVAKERLYEPEISVSEVAYALGFEHPQHFTRMFKKNTGMTPKAFQLAG
ncbi:AraC family transcriptional regulator [Lewinella sp. W8]|uniref:helix-turn-helix domain-containing protein n=1 Tax=Lewinella sp. W8 TaxID=2528208 RepID=UPI0010688C95|nr:helix-turn-helix transcriptional regulator [Lewinella sp. W8]MTB50040.1 helix-turn-helix domain-containing protein [Lewinella sp. W8]